MSIVHCRGKKFGLFVRLYSGVGCLTDSRVDEFGPSRREFKSTRQLSKVMCVQYSVTHLALAGVTPFTKNGST